MLTLPRAWAIRPALLLGAFAFASACRDAEAPTAPRAAPPLDVALELSTNAASAGQRFAVGIRATSPAGPLMGIQTQLRFDPARLRFIGQAIEGHSLALVGDRAAASGELRILSLDADGLHARTAVLVFEALAPDYGRSLQLELEGAVGRDAREYRTARLGPMTIASDLFVPSDARRLTMDDWNSALYGEAVAASTLPPGVAADPGEYRLNLRFGDANLNGTINVLDASFLANVAVGNAELIVGSTSPDRDAVVAGNVRPVNGTGLGEPSDPVPPGLEADGGRVINIFDVSAVASEANGTSQAIVGELIPGRGPLPTGRVQLCGNIVTNRTFHPDTVYELTCGVRVDSGATLTILPGTRVEGQNQSALIVQRDGRIVADGTPFEPIVMTCAAATKAKGCWGGLVVNGYAPLNAGTLSSPITAGRDATGGCFEKLGEGDTRLYGGCNAADSSGVLRYVRVEYAGFRFTPENELNGIAFQGVGNRTVVDYVQVHAGLDDGIEFFGGTVNVKHLLLTANSDDSMDWTEGWSGKAQFIIVQHDSLDSDKGFEADNLEANHSALPRAIPQIYNVTMIGKANPSSTSGSAGNNSVGALNIRRGTWPVMRNFIVAGWTTGLDIDDAATCTGLGNGFTFRNAAFAGNAANSSSDVDPSPCGVYTHSGTAAEDSVLADPANSITRAAGAAALLTSAFDVQVPDFRPRNGQASGGIAPPSDGFFDASASYLGAVPAANSTASNAPWYSGWTRGWQSASAP